MNKFRLMLAAILVAAAPACGTAQPSGADTSEGTTSAEGTSSAATENTTPSLPSDPSTSALPPPAPTGASDLVTPSIAKTIAETTAIRYEVSADSALVVVAAADQVADFIGTDLASNNVTGQIALVVLFGDKPVDKAAKIPPGQPLPVGKTAFTVITPDGILLGGLLVADMSRQFAALGTAVRLNDLI